MWLSTGVPCEMPSMKPAPVVADQV
jgi:hypothetical protein